jgi:hypothetical protein
MLGRLNIRDERGFTLPELMVGILSFTVLFGAITTMVTVTTHNQTRISDRVWANQRIRPVVTRMVDALHSSCVAPRAIPIQAGSTGNSISFITRTGSSVTPVPDKRTITLSGTNLTEQIYPASGGTPPTWTFSGTPSQTRTLLTDVSAPSGGPFRYYKYTNGALSTTPLSTSPSGLSSTDAALTSHVTITLTAAPEGGVSRIDTKSPITITDSVDLRLESAAQVTAQENPPCT